MMREFKSHRGRYLKLCRVGREADGACLESKLSEIRYIGSNPIPYVMRVGMPSGEGKGL